MFEGHDVPVHWKISPFFWFPRSDAVSFVDRWQGADALVVADLRGGMQGAKVSTYQLDATGVIDMQGCKGKTATSDYEAWEKDPSNLITINKIEV